MSATQPIPCENLAVSTNSKSMNFGASAVADYEVQLQQWMHACYEEAAAKEMEETVVRRLAAQCGIVLENQGP